MMKKKTGIILAAIMLMLAVAACGGNAGETTDVIENTASESSGELLVDGLEYLFGEEKEDILQLPEITYDTLVADGGQEASTTEKETESLIIYYGSATSDSLQSETVEAEEKSPEVIVQALARHNICSLDTKVLFFTEEETEDGKRLTLDLSKAFLEYLKTMSEEAENIIVVSLADTFLDNYGADTIFLTVEGEPLETKHAVYDEAVSRTSLEELMQWQRDDTKE